MSRTPRRGEIWIAQTWWDALGPDPRVDTGDPIVILNVTRHSRYSSRIEIMVHGAVREIIARAEHLRPMDEE